MWSESVQLGIHSKHMAFHLCCCLIQQSVFVQLIVPNFMCGPQTSAKKLLTLPLFKHKSDQPICFLTFILTQIGIRPIQAKCLLQLLLGAKVVGVSTLLLATVDSTGVKTGIAPAKKVI